MSNFYYTLINALSWQKYFKNYLFWIYLAQFVVIIAT